MMPTSHFDLAQAQKLAADNAAASFHFAGTSYKRLEMIGKGAYGLVCSAVNTRTGNKVAIKKISSAFSNVILTKRSLREFRILRRLRHVNVLGILDAFARKTARADTDLYIVLDLMDSDLSRIIHSDQPLTDLHLRTFMRQLMAGLAYIHACGIIHRDLKPSNIMINRDCRLKIGDFGMARWVASSADFVKSDVEMTQYVATRWYRAPELLLLMPTYSAAVDMWSLGCIFGEMLLRTQLFPGKDYVHQLKIIFHYCGPPPPAMRSRVTMRSLQELMTMVNEQKPVPWKSVFPLASDQAVDLLDKMLKLAPWERALAQNALNHPYFAKLDQQTPLEQPIGGATSCQDLYPNLEDTESVPLEELSQVFLEEVQKFGGAILGPNDGVTDSWLSSSDSEDEQVVDDDDIEMLSAKMSAGLSMNDAGKLEKLNKDETLSVSETTVAEESNKVVPDPKDVKQALVAKLQAKKKQQTGVTATTSASEVAGSSKPKGVTTAQKRHQEKMERKKRHFEKREQTQAPGKSKGREVAQAANGSTTGAMTDVTMSSNDRRLLERWKQMQEQQRLAQTSRQDLPVADATQDAAFFQELLDAQGHSEQFSQPIVTGQHSVQLPHNDQFLYRNFSPISAGPNNLVNSIPMSNVIQDLMHEGSTNSGIPMCLGSAKSAASKCDSAELMQTWLQASQLNPEILQDIAENVEWGAGSSVVGGK